MLSSSQVLLFVFAHQDDEFGVFQSIKEAIQHGHQVCCAYLTNGGLNGLSARRNQESLHVLSQLGVNKSDVFFPGEKLGIEDGSMVNNLSLAGDWLLNWFSNYPTIAFIYIAAWEGGHHDHDALHAVTLFVAHKKNILHLVRQFPLYNSYACLGPLFKVLSPLLENGTVIKRKISWCNRLQFMKLCLSYPSQAKTWLGIFPFLVLHYLFHGVEQTQPVSMERLLSRPHVGPLYYEKRNFFSWPKMKKSMNDWKKQSSSTGV